MRRVDRAPAPDSISLNAMAMPAPPAESWTVLGDDGVPVGPVGRYLGYLTGIERSPNKIRAYAHLCRSRHKKAYAEYPVMPLLGWLISQSCLVLSA